MSDAMAKISRELPEIAKKLQALIKEAGGEKVDFSLFIWTMPRCSYISTAERQSVIEVLEAMIAGWKAGMPDVPAHKVQ